MSTSPLRFTGVSSFSNDLQMVVDRAVQIASLPAVEMQNRQAELLSKKTLLGGLSADVGALARSLAALGSLGSAKGVSASSSDGSRVSVTASPSAAPGTYTVSEITSLAAAASATTAAGYANPGAAEVAPGGTLELAVGHDRYLIDLSGAGRNNLNGLRDAINALGAGVTATVLNTGTGETPYYLSISSNSTGRKTLELRATAGQSGTNLLAGAAAAGEAVYSSEQGFATRGATAVSADGAMQLVVGGVAYALDLTGANHLDGLRAAIDASGAGVTAAVIDTGAAVDRYRLSITAPGGQTVELRETADEPATNILTAAHLGADASFKLNGLPVTKAGNTVSGVIPGVTLNLLGVTGPGQEITISLASDRGALAAELGAFVSAYNRVAEAVNAQIGKDAGLLSGDPIIRQVQSQLRALTAYSTGGEIASLFDLGIELDSAGRMSLNRDVFDSLSNFQIAAAFEFLGSATSGLGAFSQSFAQISDPVSGFIRIQTARYDEADARLEQQISELTGRVNTMQAGLLARIQQADSLLASLESQRSMLNASLESLNMVLYGRRDR